MSYPHCKLCVRFCKVIDVSLLCFGKLWVAYLQLNYVEFVAQKVSEYIIVVALSSLIAVGM